MKFSFYFVIALFSLFIEHHCEKHFNATFVLEKSINIFLTYSYSFRENESYFWYYSYHVTTNLRNLTIVYFYLSIFFSLSIETCTNCFLKNYFFFIFITNSISRGEYFYYDWNLKLVSMPVNWNIEKKLKTKLKTKLK